jgi:hypothetical protein
LGLTTASEQAAAARGPSEGFDGPGALAIGARYVARPTGLTLDLFVSERDRIWYGRSMGWKRTRSGPLRIHAIAGPHPVLLDAGSASLLAEEMAASLDAVR